MEENRKKSRTELLRRYLVFGISLFIIALGISLITRSDLGTSPHNQCSIRCQSEYSCFFGYLFLLVYYHPDMHADAAVGEERHYGT